MRNRIIVATVIAAVGLLAAPSTADAVNCSAGYSCIWRDTSYVTDGSSSQKITFQAYIPNFGGWVYSGTAYSGANSASSASNTGNSERVYFYDSTNCTTFAFSLAIGTGDGNLSDASGYAPAGWNNKLESGAFDSLRPSC